MAAVTLLVTPSELRSDRVLIEGDSYRHLFRARRLDSDAELRLVDGEGTARRGRIERIDASTATVAVGAAVDPNESDLELEVWSGLPKGRRAAWLVEKGTEVGIAGLRWLDSERSSRSGASLSLQRQLRVARSAVEQCARARVPSISGPHDWPSLLRAVEEAAQAWVLDPTGPEALSVAPSAGPGLLLVGPEGGWERSELEELLELGAVPLGLGRTILRIETAVVVGAAHLIATAG